MAGFKNAHTRAGFFEKLRQQGKFKDDVAPGIPKVGAPKISAPNAPSMKAPTAPKVAGTTALMNLAKPISGLSKVKDLNPSSLSATEIAPPQMDQPQRFKKLKRLF